MVWVRDLSDGLRVFSIDVSMWVSWKFQCFPVLYEICQDVQRQVEVIDHPVLQRIVQHVAVVMDIATADTIHIRIPILTPYQ